MTKKLSIFILVFTLMAALVACGTQGIDETDPATGETEQNDTTSSTEVNIVDTIKAEGKFLIGTEGTYAPFTFHDPATGELTGFDVEIATEIAKRMGVEPVFMETQWDAMFAGLDTKRFDMIANQVGIREDRLEKYDFSEPYIVSAGVLVVHEDNENVKDFEDISGLKAAQTLTSNLTDIAREHGAEIVGVEGFNQAMDLLVSKRVDVTINDGLSALDFLKQRPETPIKIVARHHDVAKNGFMFRKGNPELVEAVNQALADMMEDGTYLQISEKWFGEDVSK